MCSNWYAGEILQNYEAGRRYCKTKKQGGGIAKLVILIQEKEILKTKKYTDVQATGILYLKGGDIAKLRTEK